MTLGELLVNSEFKMSLLEINRNAIIWSMGPMDHMYRPGTYGTYLIVECHHHPIGMDYLYGVIFKMAASEVKLRFRLSLCV